MATPINVRVVAGGAAGGLAAALALIVPFIGQHEGHTSRPYRDVGGVLTVCDGHTGPDIVVKTYSPVECNALLDKDVAVAANGVLAISPELKDKPYVLGATISFSYNVGIQAYGKSSVARDFKAGEFKLGCAAMLKYVYVNGKFVQGLENRREAEYVICMKGT